ncbi:hypothetical protein L7F22_039222 [Adiantum nelumboides]|nr:hypothetical protein [Adiantum nelumboides]
MKSISTSTTLLFFTCFIAITKALNNGKSITPHMGWNTWNYHGCNISEEIILQAAKQVKASGLQQKGYKLIWIDDCWQADKRDEKTGEIPANSEKFPNGLKSVTDQLHNLGFEAGIYSSAGTLTCGGKIGSLDHEEVDAKSWANAGFDALKYDNCHNQGRMGTPQLSFDRYFAMSDAINKTGRPMVMGLCNWGEDSPWYFAPDTWNSWRISGDIFDTFNKDDDRCPCTSMIDCKFAGFHCSVEKIINFAAPLGQKAASSSWNDLDMLEVGNGGMNKEEEITHFSMWAMVKSPLIMGNDMAVLTNRTLAILGNEDVIAINQDSTYTPAVRIWTKGKQQLWLTSLANSTYAISLTNFDDKEVNLTSNFKEIFIDKPSEANKKYHIYDLWANVNFENASKSKPATRMSETAYSNSLPQLNVPAHGTRLLKLVLVNGSSSDTTMQARKLSPIPKRERQSRH